MTPQLLGVIQDFYKLTDKPQVEHKKITDFEPDNANANKGTERGLRMLDDSLSLVGAGRSIVVDKHGRIIGGNKTTERAIDNGFEDAIVVHTTGDKLVVVQRDDLDLYDPAPDNRARMLAYYDNRVGQLDLDWNAEQLLTDNQLGVPLDKFFSGDELADFGIGKQEPPEDTGAQVDRADELQAVWQVSKGDVWVIPSLTGNGEHRLLCGDSTNADDVVTVMGDDDCEICFTSPPYADQREYSGNDLSIETLVQFIPVAKDYVRFFCVNLGIKRKDYEVIPYWDGYIKAAKDCGLKLLSWNVWNKINATSVIMQMAMFAIQHEWIFVFGTDEKALVRTVDKSPESAKREKYYSKDSNGRSVTTRRQPDGTVKESIIGTVYDKKQMGTVLSVYAEMGRQADLNVHAARFPVELPSEYIIAMTNDNDRIFDPFGGSGTTMVACEQLSRQCRMIEISEKYCAVILQRMQDLGCTPVKAE